MSVYTQVRKMAAIQLFPLHFPLNRSKKAGSFFFFLFPKLFQLYLPCCAAIGDRLFFNSVLRALCGEPDHLVSSAQRTSSFCSQLILHLVPLLTLLFFFFLPMMGFFFFFNHLKYSVYLFFQNIIILYIGWRVCVGGGGGRLQTVNSCIG